jgi:hypothetical protein
VTHHLVKLWFEHPREHAWFAAADADNPEHLLRVTIETLAYRCHPNREFQRGFDRAVVHAGQLGFPADTETGRIATTLSWCRSEPDAPHPEMATCYPLLRRFARENLKHELREKGTPDQIKARIESIVWLVGKTRSPKAPIICNAFAHDTFDLNSMEVPDVWDCPPIMEREQALRDYADSLRVSIPPPPVEIPPFEVFS